MLRLSDVLKEGEGTRECEQLSQNKTTRGRLATPHTEEQLESPIGGAAALLAQQQGRPDVAVQPVSASGRSPDGSLNSSRRVGISLILRTFQGLPKHHPLLLSRIRHVMALTVGSKSHEESCPLDNWGKREERTIRAQTGR